MNDESDKGKRDENRRLTIEEIEQLPEDEFEALPQDVKRKYFDWMTRDNLPPEWECYGYESERAYRAEQENFVLPDGYLEEEGCSEGRESCEVESPDEQWLAIGDGLLISVTEIDWADDEQPEMGPKGETVRSHVGDFDRPV